MLNSKRYMAGYDAGLTVGMMDRAILCQNNRAEIAALKGEVQRLRGIVADLRIDRSRLEWQLRRASIHLQKTKGETA